MTQTPPPPWRPADPRAVDPIAPAPLERPPRIPRGADGGPADGGRSGRDRGGRRRRWPIVVLVLALLLVLMAGILGVYGLSLARSFDDNRHVVDPGPLEAAGTGPMNILLLGSDSRAGEDEVDIGERSDTMMLAHIPEDRSAVYIMSILRDSYVDVPGLGMSKINAAFSAGGHELAIETVEQLLDIPVHHLVEVDFEGFRGVTNTLGGVEVCNPTAFSSGQVNPSYYPRGRILLQDTAALRYVRERYAFENGDVTRVRNQQRYLSGAMDRFLSPEILANPARTNEVVSTFSDYLTVDPGFTSSTVASLAWQLRDVGSDDVEMFTIPITGDARTPEGESVIELDETAMADLRTALQEDDLPAYLEEYEEDEEDDDEDAPDSGAEAAGTGAAPLLAVLATSSAPSGDAQREEGNPCDR